VNQQWGPKVEDREIGSDLLERWALHYLGRYASSAENLRRVLTRRVRRRSPEAASAAAPLIDALVARYRESGLLETRLMPRRGCTRCIAAASRCARCGPGWRRRECRPPMSPTPCRACGPPRPIPISPRPAPLPGGAGSGRSGDLQRTFHASSARLRERASAAEWPRRCSPAPMSRRSRRWHVGSPTDVSRARMAQRDRRKRNLKPARGHASAGRRRGIRDRSGIRARR